MMGKVIIVEIIWSVEEQVCAVTSEVCDFELIIEVLNYFPSLVAGKLGFCSARHLSLQSQRKKTVITFLAASDRSDQASTRGRSCRASWYAS